MNLNGWIESPIFFTAFVRAPDFGELFAILGNV